MTSTNSSNIVGAIIRYGSCDVFRADKVIDEAGIQDDDVASYIEEFCKDTGINILEIDLVAAVYEYILNEVRTFVEEKISKDILNDLDETVSVAGNYLATSYDCSDFKPTHDLVTKALDACDKEGEIMPRFVTWFREQI